MAQINIQKYSLFLDDLRRSGFIIGTGHYLQLQAILNLAGEDASDLKYLLCPVFAKSEKQQAQFYIAFDSFFKTQIPDDKEKAEPVQAPTTPPKWRYFVFGILLLANVVLYYLAKDEIRFAWNSLTSKEIQTKPPVDTPKTPIEPDKPKDKPSQPDKPIVEQPKPEVVNQQTPVEKPKEPEKTFDQQYWQIIRWIGILAPILIFLLTEWYCYDRRKLILQRESSRKPPYSWELNIESPDVRFLKNEQFYTTTRLMRQRLESDIQIPDVDKTVKQTVASAGFPKFCYKSLTKPPEYLILIDLPTHRDHYAFLADQIAESLKSEDIFVKRYFYENNPQICFEELTHERVYLSDLQAKFGESRLIVFGNGEEMLDPVSGEAEACTEIFHTWQDRAILTPERPQHWGMREITLAKQFIVLPDTPEGLIELARHFDAASMPDLKRWHEEDANPDISEDKLYDVKVLQDYLGKDAFQWLCACAVYPELHWNLTLYLGMTDKKWLTEDNLLKLIRLPWFRKGVMPDTLRWELIVALDKEKNQVIREAIVKMLEKSPPPEDSHAYHQYSLNLAMQKWMLGKKSWKEKQEILKTLRQADENEVVRDYTFLRFLESVPNSPLPFVLPKYLRKVLYKNGVPMFGMRTGVRLMMTALCVVLILLTIKLVKPVNNRTEISKYRDVFKFERFWPVLQQYWYFNKPNGITADDNFIYVADTASNRIQKYTIEGYFVMQWGKYGSNSGEFNKPYGIVADSMGYVYVADTWNSRIQKFTTDGEFVSEWTGGVRDTFTPTGIAIDRKNYIYVVDTSGQYIHKYASDGRFIRKWQCQNGRSDLFSGIAINDKGFVYVSDSLNHQIRKFTSDGLWVQQWGGQGKEAGQLNLPSGIAVDREGYVYVCEKDNDRIQKFTSDGTSVLIWGSVGAADDQFTSPTGIAIGKNGRLYISDWSNDRIQICSTDGKFLNNWQSRGSVAGKFDSPEAVAADSAGNIYVADKNNNRVQKFDSDGKFIREWNGEDSAEGKMNTPFGIAVSGQDVYVADTMNHRIRRFDLNGRSGAGWGGFGTADGQFNKPLGVAANKEADGKVYVYVTDGDHYRVQKFDANGTFRLKWGSYGDGGGTFRKPDGIAVQNGYVYVADRDNHLIQKFDINGTYAAQWGGYGKENGKLNNPSEVAVFENYIYVADKNNHRIVKFKPDGQFEASFGVFGAGPSQFESPVGLCFGNQGRLYVSESGNNRIQVFNVRRQKNTKAIIVAGKGEGSLWNAIQMNANFAYRTLTYLGVGKNMIYYLSSDINLDLDNDGKKDVNATVTIANLKQAITQWSVNSENLIVYMLGQGIKGNFRLNDIEILSPSTLSLWLDEIQTGIPGKVIVIYDADDGGSLLSSIKPSDKKIIITSTSDNEKANFLTQGVSFSYSFWGNIFNGFDVLKAFDLARESISYTIQFQHPMMNGKIDEFYIE